MAGVALEDDLYADLSTLWSLCIEWHCSGMHSPGELSKFLDDRWRWGTVENPDRTAAEDPTIATTDEERRAAAGLLALAGGPAE